MHISSQKILKTIQKHLQYVWFENTLNQIVENYNLFSVGKQGSMR